PKQPATFLYKVTRKEGAEKTRFLGLEYSVLRDEVEELLKSEVLAALEGGLGRYTRLLLPILWKYAQRKITALDLERAAMTGKLTVGFVEGINWAAELKGLDHPS